MKIDPIVKDILNELKFNPAECLWEKHGATCMKHRYIEIAGQNKGVVINSLDEVEKNSAEGVVAIKCTASLGKSKVITYGEATPKNNKNSYPYAMAEKRAVDRAILKLIGIHGFVYSDDEDIVETNIVNLEEYSVDKSSYCKERAEPKNLIWSQNFDENYLSPNVWNYSTSNGFYDGKEFISGWGNGELQYYTKPRKSESNTNTSKNLFIENGYLKIQPIYRKDKSRISSGEAAYNFTSARINTKNLKSFSYPSKISICFKVPKGIGFWPAFWLMPSEDISWPVGGEIDILENRGRISNISSSALHLANNGIKNLRL